MINVDMYAYMSRWCLIKNEETILYMYKSMRENETGHCHPKCRLDIQMRGG